MLLEELNENKVREYCINICKGHCCKNVGLKLSPEMLEERYVAFTENKSKPFTIGQPWLIYPMLRFTRKSKDRYFYKCKHLIKNKCSIYNHRPDMCSGCGTTYIPDYSKCIYNKAANDIHSDV